MTATAVEPAVATVSTKIAGLRTRVDVPLTPGMTFADACVAAANQLGVTFDPAVATPVADSRPVAWTDAVPETTQRVDTAPNVANG